MKNIVIIGPVGVGKTTIAQMVADELDKNLLSVDDVRYKYYKLLGFSRRKEFFYVIRGFDKVNAYYKPYEAFTVKTILREYDGMVIDFGASHSVYDSVKRFAKVKSALRRYAFVILLLPSPSKEDSEKILLERTHFKSNYVFIQSDCNLLLADATIYTEGKTIEEIFNEVMHVIIAKHYSGKEYLID